MTNGGIVLLINTVKVCPHAGGVGLCEMVQHLQFWDYANLSGTMEGRLIEYVDQQHEHFIDPCDVVNARYMAPKVYFIDFLPQKIKVISQIDNFLTLTKIQPPNFEITTKRALAGITDRDRFKIVFPNWYIVFYNSPRTSDIITYFINDYIEAMTRLLGIRYNK